MAAPRKAKKSSQERSEPKVDSEDIKKEVCKLREANNMDPKFTRDNTNQKQKMQQQQQSNNNAHATEAKKERYLPDCQPCTTLSMNNDIVFDCAADAHIFNNANLLMNIRESSKKLTFSGIISNITTNQIGDTNNFGEIYYHKDASYNILSQSRIVDMGHKVTYYTNQDYYKVVCKPSEDIYYFTRSNGLYVYTAVPYESQVLSEHNGTQSTILSTIDFGSTFSIERNPTEV
jgi:hypothetical protein